MKLTFQQRVALEIIDFPDPNGDSKTIEVYGKGTFADKWGVWLNYRTAEALERRGLVTIDRQSNGWDVQRIDGSEGS